MNAKMQTSFRLHKETLEKLDKIVEKPPAWLNDVSIGAVQDRTDVLERLVKLAFTQCQPLQLPVGIPADETAKKAIDRKATQRSKSRNS